MTASINTRPLTSSEHVQLVATNAAVAMSRLNYGIVAIGLADLDSGETRIVVEDKVDGQLYHLLLQPVCKHLNMPVPPETPQGRCAHCAS